ncbi:hypothetical protein PG993_008934 [Apiospora rasikravindrae]|uniref:Uncharacterized protein n=1 Tax=Apiospora rasikravindrae TaxID=990691 RepID=A0ABR1SRH7_9PEZI
MEESNVSGMRRLQQRYQESAEEKGGINVQETACNDADNKLIEDLKQRLAALDIESQHLVYRIMEEREGPRMEIEDLRREYRVKAPKVMDQCKAAMSGH